MTRRKVKYENTGPQDIFNSKIEKLSFQFWEKEREAFCL